MAANSNREPADAQVDGSAVRAELDRILGSASFEQAERASAFLRFVVEEALAGRGDRVKGYTIAVEVFGKSADFDAQSDPLVRVEAGRLRRKLVEYYAAEGRNAPVRIELPRGSYLPEFQLDPKERSANSLPFVKMPWRRVRALLVAFVILAALGVIALQQLRDMQPPASAAQGADDRGPESALAVPGGPRLLVLPFKNLSGDPRLDYFTGGMTEEVMLRLAEFDLFVIASQTSWHYRDSEVLPESAGTEVDAGYVLTGTVRNMPERVRISARLIDTHTGEQLWTAAFDETLSVETLLSIQERIAQHVVATIAVPYGPIFEHELAHTAHKPAEHLDTYDCLLKYYYYRRTIDPALHGEALDCFQRAIVREPAYAEAWAGLALLYLDEYGFGYSPQPGLTDPLARAGEATRKAMDIDGQSHLANIAMARVRFFGGDRAGFERSAGRSLALDPNNADTLALIGTLYAIMGATQRAQPLIDKAALLSPHPPGTYHLARTLIELRAGRADSALEAALKLDSPNWFIAPLLVTVTASLAGRDDIAARAKASLLELYPTIAERVREELAKWPLDAELSDELLRGLRAAGFEIP